MNDIKNTKDPQLVRRRIFIGNIPEFCNKDELENHFSKFGNITAVLVQKNFAFVQYENESNANNAAAAMNGTIMKGQKLTVRNAFGGKGKKAAHNDSGSNMSKFDNSNVAKNVQPIVPYPPTTVLTPPQIERNDCEIIVVQKSLTQYAEFIESRLKSMGLKVDVLFPNEDVPIGKVLATISTRGCLYAILIMPQNQEHRSITVNILHGQPAEHRNMPFEAAFKLISTDYASIKKNTLLISPPIPQPIRMNPGPNTTFISPVIAPIKPHPEDIQQILSLLAQNSSLTILQYDRIIKYLSMKRDIQSKEEVGISENIDIPPIATVQNEPDPEIELQKKIFNILNKSSISNSNVKQLHFPTVKSLEGQSSTLELLSDVRVQAALDSLMKTNLVPKIKKDYNFL